MIDCLRWCRRYRLPLRTALTVALALAMTLSLTATPARAQEPPPGGGTEEKGRPLDGYIATGCLVGLTLFLVAKSARRTTGR
jgi:hypothetical protein